MKAFVRLLAWLALGGTEIASAQSMSDVPGVVVGYSPSPSLTDLLLDREVYVSSPSIAVLPNGDYVASHDLFGAGSGATTSGTTRVYRSTDKGRTWSGPVVLTDMGRGSLFVHNGLLYLLGYAKESGNIVLRRSSSGGVTWTTPTGSTVGLLKVGSYGGTPSIPVVHGGKIWIAQSTGVLSASTDSDLLNAASWKLSNKIAANTAWFDGKFELWSEAQVVASPATGVVLLPKIQPLAYTALLRANTSTGSLSFDAANDFVSTPGTEKKFGATYDPVSARFYLLSNPVLPAHVDFGVPQLTRNTAAILVSSDLRHWDVQQIFLYASKISYTAFQYFNFAIEGEDLVVVSRTAFDVGGNKPPRGHDSNLMTFHRVAGFRTSRPRHVLVVDPVGNQVSRHELTGYERAPLGKFALGASFAGAALTKPTAVAQTAGGDVYVREQSGRVLRFDAAGNFLDLAAAPAGTNFVTDELVVTPPPAGERSWIAAGGGDWWEPLNWYYWGRPDTGDEVAIFGSAIAAAATVTLPQPVTLRGLRFQHASSYRLEGTGPITLGKDAPALIDVAAGAHVLALPLMLAGDTFVQVATGTRLTLSGVVAAGEGTLSVQGGGTLEVDGALALLGGTLQVNGDTALVFGPGAALTLDGALRFEPSAPVRYAEGMRFSLVSGLAGRAERFARLELPALPEGLAWDATALYRDGSIAVVAVLDVREPEAILRYALGTTAEGGAALPTLTWLQNGPAFSFDRKRADISYVVQVSEDLVTWIDHAINPGVVGTRVTVQLSLASGRCFMRLKLTVPE